MPSPRSPFALALIALVACKQTPPDIAVGEAWAREMAPGQTSATVYLTIDNRGGADRLVSAASPAAPKTTLHSSTIEGGISRMRALPNGLAVPAGGKLELSPGGSHIMLERLPTPLRRGDRVPLMLHFERSGERSMTLNVTAADAANTMEHGH